MDFTFVNTSRSHHGRIVYETDLFYCLRLEGEDALTRLQECLRRGDDVTGKYKGWTFLTTVCRLGRLEELNIVIKHIKKVNQLPHDRTDKMTCVNSEDSDQPGHPPSLIRVLAVCMKKHWGLGYP